MYDVEQVTTRRSTACGPACLKMLLAYNGVDVELGQLVEECGVGVGGCTGADLMRVGRAHGLDMRAWRMDAEEVMAQDRPLIVWWQYNHWCVFAGRDEDGRVWVCNPSGGRYRVSEGTFATMYTGVCVSAGEPLALGAEDNIAKGAIFRYERQYYRALAAIPRGEEVIVGSNAMAIDMVEIINQLETKE